MCEAIGCAAYAVRPIDVQPHANNERVTNTDRERIARSCAALTNHQLAMQLDEEAVGECSLLAESLMREAASRLRQ